MKIRHAIIASASVFALLGQSAAAYSAEVLVGNIGELSGAAADIGRSHRQGIELGAEWVNANLDMAGNTVKVISEDDATDKGQALTLLNKFALDNKASIVIGTASSVLGASIAPRADELQIPMVTIAYSAEVVKDRQWVYKISDTIPNMFGAIAAYTTDVLKPAKCVRAWARDNDGYVLHAKIWGDAVSAKGVQILDDVTVLISDTDFTAAATKIVSLQPDCIYIAMSPESSANFLIQARTAGLDANTTVIGGTTMGTNFFLEAAGTAAEGVYSLAEYVPGGVNEIGARFDEAYKAKYNESPDNFAAAGFTVMQVIGHALKAAGPDPSREAIKAALATVKDIDVVIGKGNYSIVDQIGRYEMNVLQVKDGKLVPAPAKAQ